MIRRPENNPKETDAKARAKKSDGVWSIASMARWAVGTFLALCLTVGSLLAYHRVEQFLIRDQRFVLNGDDEE